MTVPKRKHSSCSDMVTRTQLAILHHNANTVLPEARQASEKKSLSKKEKYHLLCAKQGGKLSCEKDQNFKII